MKASLFALGFLLLAPFTAFAEEAVANGPAPASVETPASPHTELPGGLAHNCLGSLCAENVSRLTSGPITVTIDSFKSN